MAERMRFEEVLERVKECFIVGKVKYDGCIPKEVFGRNFSGVCNDYVLLPRERIARIVDSKYDFYMVRLDHYRDFLIEGVELDRIRKFEGIINIDFGKSRRKYTIVGKRFRDKKETILFITRILDRVYDCEGDDYSFTEIAKSIIEEYEKADKFYTVSDILSDLSEKTERHQCYWDPETDEYDEWTEPLFLVEVRDWREYMHKYQYRIYITYNKPDLVILFNWCCVAVIERWYEYWWDKKILDDNLETL